MTKIVCKDECDGEDWSENSLSVSYTPRTRRISKAKKGKRVHSCKYPDCDKVFTRAEHKRRHEMRHSAKKLYHCTHTGCMLAFESPQNFIRHVNEHQSLESQSPDASPYVKSSQINSGARSESASLLSTSHPEYITTRSNEADGPTIATAEWINNQIYATENIPVHEAKFSPVEVQPAPLLHDAFPELVEPTSFAFAGQVQDICYSSGGSTTATFPDINSAIMHQMKSELSPLQDSRQLTVQEPWQFTSPDAPIADTHCVFPMHQMHWMGQGEAT